jgi:hypothetical protein
VKSWIHILALVFFAMSCETGFSPNLDSDSIPVVYAVLNEVDSIHSIRLSKTFLTDVSIHTQGVPGDSLYYRDAEVRLERWFYGNFVQEARFELTDSINRNSGLFPTAAVPLYQLKRDDLNWRFFDGYPGEIFRLIIEIPDQPIVYSEFKLVRPLEMIYPRSNGRSFNMYDFKVAFTSYSNWTEMFIRFHYLNRYQDSTTSEIASWREFHDHADIEKDGLTKEYKVPVEGIPLFYRIGKVIPEDEKVFNRKFEYAELVFNCLDENIYQYNESKLAAPSDQAGRPYTNVVNGIGIVGSRYTHSISFLFDYGSIWQLCNGEFTKHLKFVDW